MGRAALCCTVFLLVRVFMLQEAATSQIRIEPGHGNTRGRLQVFHDGVWGTVCDDNFGSPDATVACRALGMDRKYAVPWNFGPGSGPILLDDLACRGNETTLDHCLHNGWGNHECEHSEDIGVICTDDEVIVTPTNVPVMVPEGDHVNFTCVALGSRGLPFQYQWSIGTVSRHSSILLTAERHEVINDTLTCTLISDNGSIIGSSTVIIDVQYPPPAFMERSLAVISGNDTCICQDGLGNPRAAPTKWSRMGLTSQWNNCTLCMHDVEESDSGQYLVVMENTLVNNVMNTTQAGIGVQVVDLVITHGENTDAVMMDASSSSCSPNCTTFIVGGSLGLVILVLVGLLIRQQNLSSEKTSTEGDKVEKCSSQLYLHCVHRDQNHLPLSTCDITYSRAEYPGVTERCQTHETAGEHGDEQRYNEEEAMMEAHVYETV